MKRGESYGGGQSSLGYLFGSPKDPQPNPNDNPPPSASTLIPPYGIETPDHIHHPKDPISPSPDPIHGGSSLKIPEAQRGNSLGKFILDRPTTKVKSVPGGSSSLGYLFGDK